MKKHYKHVVKLVSVIFNKLCMTFSSVGMYLLCEYFAQLNDKKLGIHLGNAFKLLHFSLIVELR